MPFRTNAECEAARCDELLDVVGTDREERQEGWWISKTRAKMVVVE